MLDAGTGCLMPETGCRIPDAGFWMLDAGYSIMDAGYGRRMAFGTRVRPVVAGRMKITKNPISPSAHSMARCLTLCAMPRMPCPFYPHLASRTPQLVTRIPHPVTRTPQLVTRTPQLVTRIPHPVTRTS